MANRLPDDFFLDPGGRFGSLLTSYGDRPPRQSQENPGDSARSALTGLKNTP
jgi:hypothetical protein